jgi:glutamate dehydrogenase/leucine dehydrogenase
MSELEIEVPGAVPGSPSGWLIIDSTVNGRSHGGLRISPHVTREELRLLARKMTLKFGFIGIANGGAKAGIIGDPEAPFEVRQKLLKHFAESIGPLVRERKYLPHPDMGTTDTEIHKAFWNLSASSEPGRERSGYFTGLGVFIAASVIAGKLGKNLSNLKVAIIGFGKVGSSLAGFLEEAGAKVLAVSTSRGALYKEEGLPVTEMQRKAVELGSKFVLNFENASMISKEEILQLPVDLLMPCAHSWMITSENADQVQAKVICGGANAPVTEEAELILASRSILSLPDFLTNSGGTLGGTMFFAGIPVDRIRVLMQSYLEPRFVQLFEKSRTDVEQYCLNRFANVKRQAENGGFKQKIFQLGLEFYRRGIVPKSLVSRLASRYFLSR